MVQIPRSGSFFLFGPRQTGKTTLVVGAFRDNCWHVNLLLESTFLSYAKEPGLFRAHAVERVTKQGTQVIIVDEVQRHPGLLNDVQSVMDEYPHVRFVLTGSSARRLKRAGVNLLAGRAVERRLFPYTYAEIADRFALDDVLRYGTLPGLFDASPEEKRDHLAAYVSTYLREEIRQEGIVRNIGAFARFLDIAAAQNAELVNCSDVARECGLSSHTVKAHYQVLEDTLVAFPLTAWSRSMRRRLVKHPKYYFFDLGVVNALNRRLTAELDPRTRGRLFEALVVLEAYRRLHYARSEAALHYWRTSGGAEVDLVMEKHGRLVAACEVKASQAVSSPDLSGLREFASDNPGVPCWVACTTPQAYERDGVRVAPWQEVVEDLVRLM